MTETFILQEGAVYYSKKVFGEMRTFRRITGLVGKHVIYSDGGDLLFCCKRKKFLAWVGEIA